MQIEINHQDIEAAIQASATKAIADQVGGYGVRAAIAGAITEEFATGVIGTAVRKAVEGVDQDALADVLGRELQKAATAAVVAILRDAITGIVGTLRGIESYDSQREQKLAAIRAEIFGEPVRPVAPIEIV